MEIKDLGERKLIGIIRSVQGYRWPNSDCAYFDVGNRRILVTNDSITSKTHIPSGASPQDIGYFFAAVNLSDIAAMGGTPKYFMSSLVLPSNLDVNYLKGLQVGVKRCLKRYGARIIGGDLKKGTEIVLTGIAIGEVDRNKMMQRLSMRRGEALCVTGKLGGNAAGYYSWKSGAKAGAKQLLSVEPRIREGKFLSDNGVRAAMDLSDGVYSAIHQISAATGLGFTIGYDSLPVSEHARKASVKYGLSIENLCLNFGGEYELLFSVGARRFGALASKAKARGISITRIGTINGNGNYLVKEGKKISISKYGYEHFITD